MSPEQRSLMRFARGSFYCSGLGREGEVCHLCSHSFTLPLGRELCSKRSGGEENKFFFRWMSFFLEPALENLFAHTWIKQFWASDLGKNRAALNPPSTQLLVSSCSGAQVCRFVFLLLGWGGKAAFQRIVPRNVNWRLLLLPCPVGSAAQTPLVSLRTGLW